ncbi:oxygen-independent coproporphyrinogen III oxidase [Mesorhizobium australicum WSM2073]|uniref:Coproporphyrinogen-III oxidase n=3 Tax=Mesorhizobium TaxID=68287 RepID=L0KT67_MESAW|nr:MULTISPECIES: oxygen-independent coproporphyrinogen III oxidase [Mesorhizobium]ADV14609.1 oxygen-independent coproporphyrinogen III oxidase [Mesorhizobium ciceri biovar biserrulae WSM1271]AEH90495.1 oxygen-independent coproporphyrinogen III oxidase [Mesorhizobium opportunistum WSM2075]AGB47865.1 oxygen-independent coproporphyrinogen III oxidase [Mesorhizobium australicum WSM2073]OBP90027.1 oxygen-independent coproporphyrinogen III oxidase [Mesorhizobium loti]
MQSKVAARIVENVPRYTSYPTAPHFHVGVDAADYRGWLEALSEDDEISLYVHIPFCDRLCWFCACHTKQTRHYEPVTRYLGSLHAEIATVSGLAGGKGRVRAVHLGGGSPTMLRPDDMVALGTALRHSFSFLPGTRISVEIEPNDMDEARLDALAEIGMTRASLGVQDLDQKVQRAINREQTFLQTKTVVDGVRSRGVESVNLDLLYGLPHQTREIVLSTVRQALTLEPDRIALFGYAHVPWFKKHQTMIDQAWLPGPEERLAQSQLAARAILDQGYEPIGLDHFAKPDDALALAARAGTLRRNFQGYTEDRCETLIGLGPSSISQFRQGYVQNMPSTAEYGRMVDDGGLASVRGIAFSNDDRARGWVIERLMCDFGFSAVDLVERFGKAGQKLLLRSSTVALDKSVRLELDGDRFVVPLESRPFVRCVAAKFDKYLKTGKARHSVGV